MSLGRVLPVLLLAAGPVAAELPAGGYDCWIGAMRLGAIHVKGLKYREPALDAPTGPSWSYRMDGPAITWDGPLGGISGVGTIVSTVAKGDAEGRLRGFDILIEMAGSGNFQSVSCHAPG